MPVGIGGFTETISKQNEVIGRLGRPDQLISSPGCLRRSGDCQLRPLQVANIHAKAESRSYVYRRYKGAKYHLPGTHGGDGTCLYGVVEQHRRTEGITAKTRQAY